ncbi:hypothetical protein CMUS01_15225 [Colletotrichum musicola]|uniref:Uncharacterized protein n=1 Tax=Colletotrichum musicola TaxID=2175873 RepID=A0A8H6IYQ6_9PEZI|nr:hypothetical protein CMUS01_15225 [Colletotrichum musicola]
MTLRRFTTCLPEGEASTEGGRERVIADLDGQATSSMIAEKDDDSACFQAKKGKESATEGHQSSSNWHSSDGEHPQGIDPKTVVAFRALAISTGRGAARRSPGKTRPARQESRRQDDQARRNIKPPVRIRYIPKKTQQQSIERMEKTPFDRELSEDPELSEAEIQQRRLEIQHSDPVTWAFMNPTKQQLQSQELEFQELCAAIYDRSIDKIARHFGGTVEDIPDEYHETFKQRCMVRASNQMTEFTAQRITK